MADTLLTNETASPLGLYDADGSYVVIGAMGGSAIVDPDMTSADVIGVYTASGAASASTPSAPVNTVAPSISGDAVVGETLTAEPGTWTGNPEPTFAYQWNADGDAIPGATGKTRKLDAAELAAEITVTVTATSIAGTASETSAAVGPVTEAE